MVFSFSVEAPDKKENLGSPLFSPESEPPSEKPGLVPDAFLTSGALALPEENSTSFPSLLAVVSVLPKEKLGIPVSRLSAALPSLGFSPLVTVSGLTKRFFLPLAFSGIS